MNISTSYFKGGEAAVFKKTLCNFCFKRYQCRLLVRAFRPRYASYASRMGIPLQAVPARETHRRCKEISKTHSAMSLDLQYAESSESF